MNPPPPAKFLFYEGPISWRCIVNKHCESNILHKELFLNTYKWFLLLFCGIQQHWIQHISKIWSSSIQYFRVSRFVSLAYDRGVFALPAVKHYGPLLCLPARGSKETYYVTVAGARGPENVRHPSRQSFCWWGNTLKDWIDTFSIVNWLYLPMFL